MQRTVRTRAVGRLGVLANAKDERRILRLRERVRKGHQPTSVTTAGRHRHLKAHQSQLAPPYLARRPPRLLKACHPCLLSRLLRRSRLPPLHLAYLKIKSLLLAVLPLDERNQLLLQEVGAKAEAGGVSQRQEQARATTAAWQVARPRLGLGLCVLKLKTGRAWSWTSGRKMLMTRGWAQMQSKDGGTTCIRCSKSSLSTPTSRFLSVAAPFTSTPSRHRRQGRAAWRPWALKHVSARALHCFHLLCFDLVRPRPCAVI